MSRYKKLVFSVATQQPISKTEEETTTGNESPESGNRDEGYSTMSSDVQAEVSKTSVETRGLEDLQEACDEAEFPETSSTLLITDNNNTQHPDVLYIPLNVLNVNSR